MKDIQNAINKLFSNNKEIIFGFTKIDYCNFGKVYKSALVFAVPYTKQLSLKTYKENEFEEGILGAQKIIEKKIKEIDELLRKNKVKYYVPQVAQPNDGKFLAEFSFKTAAAHAGLGWFGKNDVIITEKYGPRVRLSAVLIDEEFQYGTPYIKSMCPPDCSKCVDICPKKTLKNKSWTIDTPREDMIDYKLCSHYRGTFKDKLGRSNSCGLCMVVCPFGSKN